MPRGLSSDMLAAIAAGTVHPVVFGYFDFTGGEVRVCSNNQDLVWAGQTWTGLGDLVKVERIKETKTVRANGLVVSLNGIPSALIAEVLANRSRGRNCALWFGCFDAAGNVIDTPDKRFSGRMDQPVIEDRGEDCDVSITAESRLADLQRSRERRLTHEDQQAEYPGDLGLEFVAGLQNKELVWGAGRSATSPAANAPSAGVGAGYTQDNQQEN